MKWGEIDTNPFESVSAPRGVRSAAVKFYTAGEVRALSETQRGALWRFLACTGMRRGEAVKAVQSCDVVSDGKTTVLRIESNSAGRTKSGRWREVPLNAAALESLMGLPDRIADCHPDTLGDWLGMLTTRRRSYTPTYTLRGRRRPLKSFRFGA